MKASVRAAIHGMSPAIAAFFFVSATVCQSTAQAATVTRSEWRSALDGSYRAEKMKSEDAGVTNFSACFSPADGKKCDLFTFARRDTFRKLTFFDMPVTSFYRLGNYESAIGIYISVPDCGLPVLFMIPKAISRSKWNQSKKLIVISGDDIVFESDIKPSEIQRDYDSGMFVETISIAFTLDEISKLSKMVDAKKLSARIQGDRTYIDVPKKTADLFSADLKRSIPIYQKIAQSIGKYAGYTCTN